MNTRDHPPRNRMFALRILVVLLTAVTIYGLHALQQTGQAYDALSAQLSSAQTVVKRVKLGDKTIAIPSYDLFRTGNVWALVSKKHPLSGEAGYQLVPIPVAHGDADQKMLIARDISDPLQRLVNAAEADGEPLMVSSAYRSLAEQQRTYESFVAKNGKALAALYVSPVGASEHHTGLAVDLSSVSDLCADDSNSCSLSESGAAWLATHAARFGFIQRYPQGDQSITGVAYEPWHYRYVGPPLALAMQTTHLTFEEALAQIAPGYAKN